MQTPFGSGPRSLAPHTYPGSGPPYAHGSYGLAPHQAHQGAGGHHHGNGTWSGAAAQTPENFQRLPHQGGSPAHDGRINYDARGFALGYEAFSGAAPATAFSGFGNTALYHPQPQLKEIRRSNGFSAVDAHQQQQCAAAEAAGAHQQQQQRAAAEAEAGHQRELDVRLNTIDMNMKNMNDALRQLVDRRPAATPSEGSSEDPAASLPSVETPAADSLPHPVETPVPSFAALLPSPPAGFVRATLPEPPPEHRPTTP